MNYNYSEEDYTQMYSNLPEGLKDLVLSGRLALQVSAIGSRHGLTPEQVGKLEPAVEDVCLGLILKGELSDNIKNLVGLDSRVSNRIAAEVEIEILRPFEPELVISRHQKEDLDTKIASGKVKQPVYTKDTLDKLATAMKNKGIVPESKSPEATEEVPEDISDHANVQKIKNWHSKDESPVSDTQIIKPTANSTPKTSFDWESDFVKKPAEAIKTPEVLTQPISSAAQIVQPIIQSGVEEKLDKLTESINKLVDIRFGTPKKEDEMSPAMKEIMERLAKAEAENKQHKELISKLQTNANPKSEISEQLFGKVTDKQKPQPGETKINIDKQRKVEINKPDAQKTSSPSNIKMDAAPNTLQAQKPEQKKGESVPVSEKPQVKIESSVVSPDTLSAIVSVRKDEPIVTKTPTSTIISPPTKSEEKKLEGKSVLTLDELLKGDNKIKEATKTVPQIKTSTLVFPGVNEERKIDIKNKSQANSLKQTLLEDLDFIKRRNAEINKPENNTDAQATSENPEVSVEKPDTNQASQAQTASLSNNPFKDELIPKTKEDRMRSLQDKIKSMNKGVSAGGHTNIAVSGLDPYKI